MTLQCAFWCPPHQVLIPQHVARFIADCNKRTAQPDSPGIAKLRAAIDQDGILRMNMYKMVNQANSYLVLHPEYIKDFKDKGDTLFIRSTNHLLDLMNFIIHESPGYSDKLMVGTPLNALLCLCMGTVTGNFLFHDVTFNEYIKDILEDWHKFLISSDSRDLLDREHPERPGSWVAPEAFKTCFGDPNQFKIDTNDRYYGFKSWNDFFIREFLPGVRPFVPGDDTACNACETGPVRVVYEDLHFEQKYWIKGQPYSLKDMFANDSVASKFIGGTLYQGFLSATHYHRWNCPINGELVHSWVQPGTYFAAAPYLHESDPGANEESQPYLGHVAARAIFVFNTAAFGLIGFIAIGMVEVSTCYIHDKYHKPNRNSPAVPVKKGDELGYFMFGGSTHCLLFQHGRAKLEPWANPANQAPDAPPVHLGVKLATAIAPSPATKQQPASPPSRKGTGKRGRDD